MGKALTDEMLKIVEILNNHKYKAIVLYLLPQQVPPQRDLIELLSKMAAQNYLCFICQSSSNPENMKDADGIEMLEQNLIYLHHGFSIIPIVKNHSAVILSTQEIHPDWDEALHHKFLWYHTGPAADMESLRNRFRAFNKADLITYFQTNEKNEPDASSDPRSLSLNQGGENHYNWLLVEKRLKSNPKGWQIYANVNLQGKIAVMTATFFDFEGEFFYSGGAERYLLDLAEIGEELGREFVIFQYGNIPWMRRFKNIDVISLSRAELKAEGWVLNCAKAFNQIFYELVQGRTALNIYSAFFESWPLAATPNIGISHGVAWDNPYSTFMNGFEFWIMNERHIQGAKACEELISVDTNSANWFQTVDFNLGQRAKVIPNYVDLSQFKPREDYLEQREKRVILYPRQLYSGRGLDLVLEIMDSILEKYSDVEFHFVGRGSEQAIGLVQEKKVRWQERVKCYAQLMEEMPQTYQAADLTLIPSVHSEGTSLSCLEAMASGNAVIATRVGGLSDLIINNYNGLLIDPHPKELKQALIQLLDHSEQLTLYKKRNPEVARAFAKEQWRDRWRTIIQSKINRSSRAEMNNIVSDKGQSGRAVEIRLNKSLDDFSKLGEKITELLMEGCLVYIRAQSVPDPLLSFARIQWLKPNTPLFSPCDLTIEW